MWQMTCAFLPLPDGEQEISAASCFLRELRRIRTVQGKGEIRSTPRIKRASRHRSRLFTLIRYQRRHWSGDCNITNETNQLLCIAPTHASVTPRMPD